MRTPSELTDTEWAQLSKDYNGGLTRRELADKYDLNFESIRNAMSSRGITLSSTISIPEENVSDEAIAYQVKADREIDNLKARARHYERLYKSSISSSATQELLVDVLRDAVPALTVGSQERFTVPSGKVEGTHTAVALLSDLHVGEVVDRDAMGGLSEFNLDVFRQRVGLWIQKVLYLVDLRRSRLEIPKLVVLCDGDMVSGQIHDELIRTNSTDIVHQTIYAAELISYAIGELSRYFEEVTVSCTVGNHGRNQKKFEFKEPHVNWDYICYQHMAQRLRDHSHIKFEISKSLFQITKIENLQCLHMHGHGVRSWGGFPWHGVDRAIKSLRAALAIGDLYFDMVAMGHFHVPMEVETPTGPWIINGCWKGGDEYALGGLHTIIPPMQTLLFVHSRYGVISTEHIKLDGQTPEDAKPLPYEDHVLPEVWANGE